MLHLVLPQIFSYNQLDVIKTSIGKRHSQTMKDLWKVAKVVLKEIDKVVLRYKDHYLGKF